ncbi:MAG TPA: alpha/beta hydrolase, partial [Candidatus Nitrosotenuis sp.]|nr:alpha/beta hydrolase [Candidatus Nitrosotenuis sp.]
IYLDALAAHDYLTGQRGIAPEKIIAMGQSLGTAVAADLATQRTVGGVVLEAPFPSAAAVARRVYFFLPGITMLMRSKFDTARKLDTIHVPVLVAHCKSDPVIAFSLGEEVFRAANEPKRFFPVEAYCHEEISLVAPEAYAPVLREFLKSVESDQSKVVSKL